MNWKQRHKCRCYMHIYKKKQRIFVILFLCREVMRMKLAVKEAQVLQGVKNSAYDLLKAEFLYHSNKIEGDKFSRKELDRLVYEAIVEGRHHINDVTETFNTLKLFDNLIDTLGQTLTKRLLLQFHAILKDRTIDYDLFLAGCWKKMQNIISGTNLKLTEPEDVEIKIIELIAIWNESDKSLDDIIKFHVSFEKIHPYQDGNGRIGRLIILKQCIENNIDLVIINEKLSKEYKAALYQAQMKNNYIDIKNIFITSQELADQNMPFLKETLEYIRRSEGGTI